MLTPPQYKKRSAHYALAAVLEMRYPPLRPYCVQLVCADETVTFAAETSDSFARWNDELRWRLALARSTAPRPAPAPDAAAAPVRLPSFAPALCSR